MLTNEDLNTFIRLEKEIQKTCDHIATFFKEFDSGFEEPTYWSWEDNGSFFGSGCSIEAKWLTATDEELKQHVENVFEQRRRWKKERELREKIAKEQREQEKREYQENLCSLSREDLLRVLHVPEELIDSSKNT